MSQEILKQWNKRVKERRYFRTLKIYFLSLLIFATPLIITYGSQTIYQSLPSNETFCSNESLESTAYCLRDEVNKHFNYTMRWTDIPQTDNTLLTKGGDCSDYANYYVRQARRLGFIAEKVDMSVGKTFGHSIALISNPEGYCTLDQLEVNCVEFGN